jgi:hypothetical protein
MKRYLLGGERVYLGDTVQVSSNLSISLGFGDSEDAQKRNQECVKGKKLVGGIARESLPTETLGSTTVQHAKKIQK